MMKKVGMGAAALAVLVVVGLGVYYFFAAEPAYKNALPADVTVLVCADGKEINKAVDLEELAQLIGLSEEEQLKDCGVNLTEKIYAFYRSPESMGLLACMSDADKLTAYITKNGLFRQKVSSIEEKDGFNWLTVQENEAVLIGYNDEKLLAVGPVSGYNKEEVRQQMIKWMTQERKESALNTMLYKKLEEKKGLLTYALSMKAMPEKQMAGYDRQMMEVLAGIKEVNVAGAVQVDRKKLSCPVEFFTEDNTINGYWDKTDKHLKKLTAVSAEQAPKGLVTWMGMNLEGEPLLKQLRENPDIRTMLIALNLAADVDKIILSINGEIAFAIDSNTNMLLTADVKDETVLKDLPKWMQPYEQNGWTCKTLSDKEYLLGISVGSMPFPISVGIRGGKLYGATGSLLADGVGKKMDDNELSDYKSQIKDNVFFLLFSLPNFMKSDVYKSLTREDMRMALSLGMASRIVKDVVLSVSDARNCAFEIYWNEDSELLKSYLK